MKKNLTRGLSLLAIGVVGLVGVAVLTPGTTLVQSASAVPDTSASASVALIEKAASGDETASGADADLRQSVIDMLQTRMGLSAAEAEEQADAMVEHMTQMHGDQAGQAAEACGSADGGSGMMGGSGGSGMMGGGASSAMMGGGLW